MRTCLYQLSSITFNRINKFLLCWSIITLKMSFCFINKHHILKVPIRVLHPLFTFYEWPWGNMINHFCFWDTLSELPILHKTIFFSYFLCRIESCENTNSNQMMSVNSIGICWIIWCLDMIKHFDFISKRYSKIYWMDMSYF